MYLYPFLFRRDLFFNKKGPSITWKMGGNSMRLFTERDMTWRDVTWCEVVNSGNTWRSWRNGGLSWCDLMWLKAWYGVVDVTATRRYVMWWCIVNQLKQTTEPSRFVTSSATGRKPSSGTKQGYIHCREDFGEMIHKNRVIKKENVITRC